MGPRSRLSCRFRSVTTSALTGDGVPLLREALAESVRNPAGEGESGFLTSLRHFEAVRGALALSERRA